jgi:hypothetical protein
MGAPLRGRASCARLRRAAPADVPAREAVVGDNIMISSDTSNHEERLNEPRGFGQLDVLSLIPCLNSGSSSYSLFHEKKVSINYF